MVVTGGVAMARGEVWLSNYILLLVRVGVSEFFPNLDFSQAAVSSAFTRGNFGSDCPLVFP